MRKGIIFLCLIGVGYLTVYAQSGSVKFESLSVEEGFPNTLLSTILRNSRGFMWFGGRDGLIRYDGVDFRVYYPDKNDTTQLYEGFIQHLFEDSQGRIWLSAGVGIISGKTIQVFDPKTEKFTRLNCTPLLNAWYFNQHHTQNYFLEDEAGNMWIKSFGTGLYKIEEKSLNQFLVTNYKVSSEYPEETSADSVSVLFIDSRQKFWTGTRNGLYTFDRTNEKFIRFPDDKSGKPDQVTGIAEDKKGNIWVNYERKGLFVLHPDTQQFIEKWPEPNPTPWWFNARYLLLDNSDNIWMIRQRDGTHLHASLDRYDTNTGEVFRYFESGSKQITIDHLFHQIDHEGNIWVSCEGGIYVYNADIESFELVSKPSPSIHNLYIDRYKNIWVVDWSKGMLKFHYSNQKMKILSHEPLEWSNTCIEDNKGNIVIASENRGIISYTLNATQEVVEEKVMLREKCNNLIQDKSGRLWASCFNQETIELISIDPESYETNRFTLPPNLESIWSIAEISDQVIIMGTRNNGVLYYDIKTGEITQFLHDPHYSTGISSNISNQVFIDDQNKVWTYNQIGFDFFDTNHKKFVRMDQSSIPKKFGEIYHVYAYKNGQFWIGGAYGLYLYDPLSGKIHRNYLVKDGFPTNDILKIVSDDEGNLWMGTRSGLVYFNVKDEQFKKFDTTDGLPSNRVYTGCKRANGELVFGGDQGLVIFHPDKLPFNQHIPNPVFTELRLFNEKVDIDGKIFSKSISYIDEIVLNHDQNVISFRYSALSYASPTKNQYAYFMDGIDKEWNYIGNQTFASYAGLTPGEYVFNLKATNNDGLWNETPTTLKITILPPWWQTWWAYSLYGVLALGMFWSIRHYEIKRVKLRQRAVHLAEVDTLKSRFFANISHEFRTPLTLILGPLKEMYQGTFTGDRKAVFGVMIRNGQRLLNLINQLLDISKLEAGKMRLQTTPTELVALLRQIASSYESIATDKKIKYFFYPEMQELRVYADHEKIEKIVHNLLSNAFKFTPEGGNVILYLKTQEKQWAVLSVKDTGTGIPTEELDKVFDRFYQVDSSQTRAYEGSGLGMALAKELVEMHHGRLTVESKEGTGTTFTVWLPLGKAHLRPEEIRDGLEVETSKKVPINQDIPKEDRAEEMEDTATIMAKTNNNPLILVVEDNADMRHYIRSILGDQYQIREAENGKEGVGIALEIIPELIISDIMMPEMDGYKLCDLIKTNELTNHIPIILLTAKADRQSKLTGLETGADDYLSKPFDAEELQLIVRNRIEERQKMQERFSREITLEPRSISLTSLDEQFLSKVLDIIEDHMDDENFTVENLSREGGFSRVQFYRKIKALTDQSPSQFLRTIRLKRAAGLLQQKRDKVAQIAYSVGFSSLPYFNKCFKEQFGMTPGQYAATGQEIE